MTAIVLLASLMFALAGCASLPPPEKAARSLRLAEPGVEATPHVASATSDVAPVLDADAWPWTATQGEGWRAWNEQAWESGRVRDVLHWFAGGRSRVYDLLVWTHEHGRGDDLARAWWLVGAYLADRRLVIADPPPPVRVLGARLVARHAGHDGWLGDPIAQDETAVECRLVDRVTIELSLSDWSCPVPHVVVSDQVWIVYDGARIYVSVPAVPGREQILPIDTGQWSFRARVRYQPGDVDGDGMAGGAVDRSAIKGAMWRSAADVPRADLDRSGIVDLADQAAMKGVMP